VFPYQGRSTRPSEHKNAWWNGSIFKDLPTHQGTKILIYQRILTNYPCYVKGQYDETIETAKLIE